MWAMEYNPNTFSRYEVSRSRSDVGTDKDVASGIDNKQLKQYGKFERKNMKIGQVDQKSALAVFLVASVLEMKNKRLLSEAKGPEDVVKIVGDITASLDAKKALNDALKIQKKYLRKASSPPDLPFMHGYNLNF
ncbi:Ypt/Rab-GAP domain of gyp1p superfamily protein [Actinidia rufa]|uniref:Ypt/Rab-GAP domain of gyp1p superfamily protein n=1 Tax=Actinidia rufa TaxID=165716 RepID=A0A7J0H4K2_9ERIC|nr:Ypt/Rab-GAP domain of gyp1p superfamily protein [Actinidia rufa]